MTHFWSQAVGQNVFLGINEFLLCFGINTHLLAATSSSKAYSSRLVCQSPPFGGHIFCPRRLRRITFKQIHVTWPNSPQYSYTNRQTHACSYVNSQVNLSGKYNAVYLIIYRLASRSVTIHRSGSIYR